MADDNTKRRRRTRVQALVSACGVLLVAVPVVMSSLDGHVTGKTWAFLMAAAAAVTQGAAMVQRLMALPAVKTFVDRFVPWLSDEV